MDRPCQAHTDAREGLESVGALLLDETGHRDFEAFQSFRRGPIGPDAEAIRALLFQEERDLPEFLRDFAVLRDSHTCW
jgi:hypothetical protein